MKIKIFAVAIVICLFTVNPFAQENIKNNYPLIEKLFWLEGTYRGEKWDGISEEIWSGPIGNNIVGTYRYIKDDVIVFTEFVYIVEENNTLTFRIKHFSKEFVGWEEKDKTVDFPLIEIKDNEIIFDGLTMKKLSEDSFRSTVKIKSKNGEVTEEEFIYNKRR